MCATIERNWLATHKPSLRSAVVESTDFEHRRIDSTPWTVVDAMLRIIRPTKDDLMYDLGCGDGRIVIAAARDYGCRAIGVEIKPSRVDLARRNAFRQGVSDSVAILNGDLKETDLSYATIITMYLYTDLILQILPRTGHARCIASINHRMPKMEGLTQTAHRVDKSTVYIAI